MATSSIFADFIIRDDKTAEAFLDAVEWSRKHPRQKCDCNLRLVTDEKDIKRICEKLNKKYGWDSK